MVRRSRRRPSLFPDHDSLRTQPEERRRYPRRSSPGGRAGAPPYPADAQFDELPMPAQAEIRQARPIRRSGAMSRTITRRSGCRCCSARQCGLGRRDEDSEPPIAPAVRVPPAAAAERKPQRSVAQQNPRPSDPVSEYARGRRRRAWTPTDVRTCCARRHRATTILISLPSETAGELTIVKSDDEKRSRLIQAGTFALALEAIPAHS